MKSKISFFDKAIFRKDLTRFFPTWALYAAGLLLTFLGFAADADRPYIVSSFADSLGSFQAVTMAYAFLVVALLFGDLFKSRLCNAIHALPVRRETLFFTHCVSGLLFFLIPTAVFAGLAAIVLKQYAIVALAWFGALLASYLIFFCIALFCLMCSGNLFSYALVFLGVNFLGALVGSFYNCLYQPLLYGTYMGLEDFLAFCPIWDLVSQPLIDVKYQYLDSYRTLSIAYPGWERLAIWGVVALVLGTLALVLYHRRHLECAGDFISTPFLRPVFLLFYTLGVGLLVYLFTELWGLPGVLFLFVGVFLGFFTGLMLLGRNTRVFTKKNWLALAVFALVLVASLVLTRLDPLGITRYVPKETQIQSVTVGNFSPGYTRGDPKIVASDPEDLALITQLHRDAVANRTPDFDLSIEYTWVRITLQYTLKSGREVIRSYTIPSNTPEAAQFAKLMSRPEAVFSTEDGALHKVFADIYDAETFGQFIPPEQIPSLLDAILADCEAGTMAQLWEMQYGNLKECYITFNTHSGRYLHLQVWDRCTNTLQWLENNGYEIGAAYSAGK